MIPSPSIPGTKVRFNAGSAFAGFSGEIVAPQATSNDDPLTESFNGLKVVYDKTCVPGDDHSTVRFTAPHGSIEVVESNENLDLDMDGGLAEPHDTRMSYEPPSPI